MLNEINEVLRDSARLGFNMACELYTTEDGERLLRNLNRVYLTEYAEIQNAFCELVLSVYMAAESDPDLYDVEEAYLSLPELLVRLSLEECPDDMPVDETERLLPALPDVEDVLFYLMKDPEEDDDGNT